MTTTTNERDCTNCGRRWSHHTGSYCEHCGEPKNQPPVPPVTRCPRSVCRGTWAGARTRCPVCKMAVRPTYNRGTDR